MRVVFGALLLGVCFFVPSSPSQTPPKDMKSGPTTVGGKTLSDWKLDLTAPDPSRRAEAVIAITRFGDENAECALPLVKVTHDGDVSPRVRAVIALRMIAVDDKHLGKVIEALAARLNTATESQAIVRLEAVVSLKRFVGEKALDAAVSGLIKGTLDKGSWEIRYHCVGTLWRVGRAQKNGTEAVIYEALLAALNTDSTHLVRMEILQGLGALGKPANNPILLNKIITTLNSFHGRTMGALSATGQPKYHVGVGPLVPGFVHVPYGDLEATAKAIDAETVAIMVEPIQGEGGVNMPPAGYLEGLRSLTEKNRMLLILDEVQTGMGRTGRWYAHQHWNLTPDIVTLAKALAGGVAMGGLVARPEVAAYLRPGTHAATFGGNPLSAAAALATIETIEEDGLLARAVEIGERFRRFFDGLRSRCPWITDVRALGCMIGVELGVDGTAVVKACMERGLLINCTHGTVLRLLPAMNLSDAELEEGCGILEDVLVHLEV